MPFYEYKCDECGHQFEVLQSINAEPIELCEKCGSNVRRIIFPSAIVYKGSGFYSTEYGRSRYNHPKAAENKDTSSTEKPKGDENKSSNSEAKAASAPSEKSSNASEGKKPQKSEAAA